MANILEVIRDMILGTEETDDNTEHDTQEEYIEDEMEFSDTYQQPNISDIQTLRKAYKPKSDNVVSLTSADIRTHMVQHKPTKFEDVSKYRDILFEKKILMLDLTDVDRALAQRIMDFVGGMCYAQEGEIEKVGNIYIAMHRECDLSSLGASEEFTYSKNTFKSYTSNSAKANAK